MASAAPVVVALSMIMLVFSLPAEDFATDIGMLSVLCDDRTISGCFTAEAQTAGLAQRMNVDGDCTSARLLADCLRPCEDSPNQTLSGTYISAAARRAARCPEGGDICDDLTPSFCLAAYSTQIYINDRHRCIRI